MLGGAGWGILPEPLKGNSMDRQSTQHTTNFCPRCGAYSGKAFKVLIEGENPPDSEVLKCKECGWTGYWDDCAKHEKTFSQEMSEVGEAWNLLILEILKTKSGKLFLKMMEGLNRILLKLQRKRTT